MSKKIVPSLISYGTHPLANWQRKPALFFSAMVNSTSGSRNTREVKLQSFTPSHFSTINGKALPWKTKLEPPPSTVTSLRPSRCTTAFFMPVELPTEARKMSFASSSKKWYSPFAKRSVSPFFSRATALRTAGVALPFIGPISTIAPCAANAAIAAANVMITLFISLQNANLWWCCLQPSETPCAPC